MVKENNCLCLYIYIKPLYTFETFLIKELPNLLNYLNAKKSISHWFFIRYYEDGFHIRLRFFFENVELYEEESKYLINVLRKSILTEKIIVKKYIPEINRYGGVVAIKSAESLFHVSSLVIINLFKDITSWNYTYAFSYAIQLHYIFLSNLIIEKTERLLFLENSYIKWLSYSKIKYGTGFYQHFDQLFSRINAPLFLILDELRKNISKKTFKSKALFTWYNYMLSFHKEISNFSYISNVMKWDIFDSYMHMNNNRLGIQNCDESFIYFFLLKYMKKYNK